MEDIFRHQRVKVAPNLDNLAMVIPSHQPDVLIVVRLARLDSGLAPRLDARPPPALLGVGLLGALGVDNDARDEEADGLAELGSEAVERGRGVGLKGGARAREGVVAGDGPGDVGGVDGLGEEGLAFGEVVDLGQRREGGEDVVLGELECHVGVVLGYVSASVIDP